MQKIIAVAFCWPMSFFAMATPAISDLKVTPAEPLGIAIDFSVSGVTADAYPVAYMSAAPSGGIPFAVMYDDDRGKWTM